LNANSDFVVLFSLQKRINGFESMSGVRTSPDQSRDSGLATAVHLRCDSEHAFHVPYERTMERPTR